MAVIAEINAAIAAHSMWKSRLRQSIESGQSDTPVEIIRMDKQCTFGKWLFGSPLSPSDRASNHYRVVQDLHAKFHEAAAKAAALALSGKKVEAERMMSLGGEYAAISAQLTSAMMDGKKSLE